MNKLTIIIPFLNEGEELENTLQSIKTHSGGGVEVIVINDASTDGIDYGEIARRHDVQYVVNPRRLGVAASRDLGVQLCRTPYFLLLDAHMRFYNGDWCKTIVSELELDERVLLCCQTRILTKEDGQVTESGQCPSFGAYLDFRKENALQLEWKYTESNPGAAVEDIPCVLGAGYACSKWYWEFLKGLDGLRYYGCDEAYISLKVWLEGGRCRLLKNVEIGHIYRYTFPYQVSNADIFYNQMLIAETLLPEDVRNAVLRRLRKESADLFCEAGRLFEENREKIAGLKSYYRGIITREFPEIRNLHLPVRDKKPLILSAIGRYVHQLILQCGATDNVSLFYGKTGLAVLLYYYKQLSGKPLYAGLGSELLDEVYKGCRQGLPVDFANGICGVGWAVSWLLKENLAEGDVNGILAEVDKRVMERDLRRIIDRSLKTGLNGILAYVLTRLEDSRRTCSALPFSGGYLSELKEAALRLLGDPECRADNRLALAFIACCGDPGNNTCRFELSDFINSRKSDGDVTGTSVFDFEKGCIGFVFSNLYKACL